MHIVFNYINVFAVSLFYLKLLIVIVFAGKINKSINQSDWSKRYEKGHEMAQR